MSNRTLFEINHDLAANIAYEANGFANLLVRYLTSGDARGVAEELRNRFGVTLGPMRLHSDPEPFVPRGFADQSKD